MVLKRVKEIESMIATGDMTAAQCFTQMKQLVYRGPHCYALCEKVAFERETAKLKSLIREASDYLDTNNLTSIGSGNKFKCVV